VAVSLLGNGEALEAKPETRRLLKAYGVEWTTIRAVQTIDRRERAARRARVLERR
jgi:hypothetical protein